MSALRVVFGFVAATCDDQHTGRVAETNIDADHKETDMNRLLPALILLLLLLPLSACGLSSGPISGKVLEEGTGKPISGAIVVIRWKGYVSAIVDTRTVCVHAESTTTDEMGNYKVNGWRKSSTMGPVFYVNPVISAYRAGYGLASKPAQNDEDAYMAPFKGTREDRLMYLELMGRSSGCDSAGMSRRNLYPLYEALYYEAKVNAAKEDDLEWYRRIAAKISVGVSDQSTHDENEKRIEQFLREHLR